MFVTSLYVPALSSSPYWEDYAEIKRRLRRKELWFDMHVSEWEEAGTDEYIQGVFSGADPSQSCKNSFSMCSLCSLCFTLHAFAFYFQCSYFSAALFSHIKIVPCPPTSTPGVRAKGGQTWDRWIQHGVQTSCCCRLQSQIYRKVTAHARRFHPPRTFPSSFTLLPLCKEVRWVASYQPARICDMQRINTGREGSYRQKFCPYPDLLCIGSTVQKADGCAHSIMFGDGACVVAQTQSLHRARLCTTDWQIYTHAVALFHEKMWAFGFAHWIIARISPECNHCLLSFSSKVVVSVNTRTLI